ncbi:hypothetical protein HDU77_009656 [Chytriomyces hyalinus]|nr:hypothetical protein HDU77_009656 [Chytriomyces hyalinus]
MEHCSFNRATLGSESSRYCKDHGDEEGDGDDDKEYPEGLSVGVRQKAFFAVFLGTGTFQGSTPMDTADFASCDLTSELVTALTSEVGGNEGIIFRLRVYLVDLINRGLTLNLAWSAIVAALKCRNAVALKLGHKEVKFSDIQFSERDLMIALLESLDDELRLTIATDWMRFGHPLPILLDNVHFAKGYRAFKAVEKLENPFVILNLSFAHEGLMFQCKCKSRQVLKDIFRLRGTKAFPSWSDHDCFTNNSMDIVHCHGGNFEHRPVAVVDCHFSCDTGDTKATKFTKAVKFVAERADVILLHCCHFDMEHSDSFTELIASAHKAPKIMILHPAEDITATQMNKMRKKDREKWQKELRKRSDAMKTKIPDAIILADRSSILDICNTVRTKIAQLYSSNAVTTELDWRNLVDMGGSRLPNPLEVEFSKLTIGLLESYQEYFPLSDIQDQFESEVWNWKEESDTLDERLLSHFAEVVARESLEDLRRFRRLLGTRFQISRFWRELILASNLGTLFEVHGLTTKSLKKSILLWVQAGEPIPFILANKRMLDTDYEGGPLLKLFAEVVGMESLEQLRLFRKLLVTRFQAMEISRFWRELILASKLDKLFKVHGLTSESLKRSFLLWMQAGEPIQFILANKRMLDTDFVTEVLQEVDPHKNPTYSVFVVGNQGSGKSTLLNRTFGCRFSATKSRRTRGLYLSYRKTVLFDDSGSQPVNILVMDSEGFDSVQRKQENTDEVGLCFDAFIALLSITSSHVLLWNHSMQLHTGVTRLFETAFLKLGRDVFETLNHRVNIHFALRNMENVTHGEIAAIKAETVENIRSYTGNVDEVNRAELYNNNLSFRDYTKLVDHLVILNEDNVHLMSSAYSSSYDSDIYEGAGNKVSSPVEIFGSDINLFRKSLLVSAIRMKGVSLQDIIPKLSGMVDSILIAKFLDFDSCRVVECRRANRLDLTSREFQEMDGDFQRQIVRFSREMEKEMEKENERERKRMREY